MSQKFNLQNWTGTEVEVLPMDGDLLKAERLDYAGCLPLNELTGQFVLNGDIFALVKTQDEVDEDNWKFCSYNVVSCDDGRVVCKVGRCVTPKDMARGTSVPWTAMALDIERDGETPIIAAARMVAMIH